MTMKTTTTNEQHTRVLHAAYQAWMNAAGLRQARLRNKRFTYGDQWGDLVKDYQGRVMTEGEHLATQGCQNITNNLIRQLVKTIVGRFRSQYIKGENEDEGTPLSRTAQDNELDELDSRALEEFLISGCCIQRVDTWHEPGGDEQVRVDNVNVNRLFTGPMSDTRAWDCELIGQLHDLNIAQLLRRVAGGNQRKAAWVRRLYTDGAESRLADFTTRLGADSQLGTDFWHARDGRCRAIEVWTLESREVTVCHDRRAGTLTVEPATGNRPKSRPDVTTRWDIATVWHCRWFSPMGDLLCEYDSPWPHGSHPFVIKLYPLTDGEVHAVVEDIIDTQKHVNRLISLLDQVMRSSAKGVLLFPETALPDGWTWEDARRCWSNANGLLPYNPRYSEAKPEQVSANGTNIGAYQMIELQMRLFEEISGVSGALQGKQPTVIGANAYQLQSENANIALSDVYDTFQAFRRQRDRKIAALTSR